MTHPARSRQRGAVAFATAIAIIGVTTVSVDFARSLIASLAKGQTVLGAVFIYVRYFTVLTNAGVAALMAATAIALARRTALPPASTYRAAMVYMVVTCATYEILLRHLWSPQGLQFVTDIMFHDVQPTLTVIFWVLYAPKTTLKLATLPWLLIYPTLYFVLTLVAGLYGAGYPYDFLDAGKLGYPVVAGIAVVFLGIFFGLGALATLAAKIITGGRSQAVSR